MFAFILWYLALGIGCLALEMIYGIYAFLRYCDCSFDELLMYIAEQFKQNTTIASEICKFGLWMLIWPIEFPITLISMIILVRELKRELKKLLQEEES